MEEEEGKGRKVVGGDVLGVVEGGGENRDKGWEGGGG